MLTHTQRDASLDFAKGLAVIFMVIQHFSVWLWHVHWAKTALLVKENPLYFSAISFSALSAPLFIFAAGYGAWLFYNKYGDSAKIIRRGLFLLLLGYLHNFTIPVWFTPFSWYVLHLIGFSFLLAPLLHKLSSRKLVLVILFLVAVSFLVQTFLDTPLAMGNKRMSQMNLPFAYFRLMFVEGHFPVLPWVGVFTAGFWAAPFLSQREYKKPLALALLFWLTAALLWGAAFLLGSLETLPFWGRLFTLRVRFYPMLFPMFFFLTGAVILSVILIQKLSSRFEIGAHNPVVALGRISLTVFFTHVYVKQLASSFGFYSVFSKTVTISITLALLVFFLLYSLFVRKRSYRGTVEWLLRKV